MTTIAPVQVPYTGGVPGGVKQGLEIEIQGTVPHHAHNGFGINLCQGPQKEPNTTLHFNPRLNEHCVVMNHMQNNGWGSEDRKHNVRFHKGQAFDLRIMVKPQMFKIKLNGQHIADFPHRLPKETAQFIVIEGEVSIAYIKFSHGGAGGPQVTVQHHSHSHTATHSSIGHDVGKFLGQSANFLVKGIQTFVKQGAQPAPAGMVPGGAQPIFNPPVPFTTGIPGGINPGRMISISGVPNPSPQRFSINLQTGPYDGCDIAMHFDVRFNYGDNHNTVVRTHCQGGAWGQEEKGVSYFPFMPNANFDMLILCEPAAFKVAVNNQHLVEFRHRLPIGTANTLHVKGDVRLTQVKFT